MSRVAVIGSCVWSLVPYRRDLLRAMVDRGHDVFVLLPHEGLSPRQVEVQFGVPGLRFREYYLNRVGLNPVQDVRALWSLTGVLRETRVDHVLTCTVKPNIYGSLAARMAGVRHVSSWNTGLGYAFIGSSRTSRAVARVVRLELRLALRLNETVFFQNPDDRDVFQRFGLVNSAQPVVLFGSGIDTQEWSPRPRQQQGISFLLVTRLLWDKGIREYVEAARLLHAAHPNVQFRLLGATYQSPNAIPAQEVAAWHREGIVCYLGETSDVHEHVADASVCVLPSYREGMPRSLLEAMAMGKPIVTTDVPGCRELVVAGKNGFLVPARDAEGLARAMERFILHPDLIGPMGHESRALVENRFDVRRVVATVVQRMGL